MAVALSAQATDKGVNQATRALFPIADTPEGLDLVRKHWSGPLGAYPESGHFVMPNWQFVDIIAPDDLVTEARGWVARGAQLIGGCCGLGPDHIRALKAGLPERLSPLTPAT